MSVFFDLIKSSQEEGYELGIFDKYNFHYTRLLNILQIIMIVIADTTTTNSYGRRLATSIPAANQTHRLVQKHLT